MVLCLNTRVKEKNLRSWSLTLQPLFKRSEVASKSVPLQESRAWWVHRAARANPANQVMIVMMMIMMMMIMMMMAGTDGVDGKAGARGKRGKRGKGLKGDTVSLSTVQYSTVL